MQYLDMTAASCTTDLPSTNWKTRK